MSYSFDVNVLLYASDRSSDRHKPARIFIDSCAAGPELVCIGWPTLMAYLRISTHPRIFASPLTPDEALENVKGLLSLSHVRAISERDGFLEAYTKVCSDLAVRGNLVPEAHLATILFQHGIKTLYSSDRDFRKFEFLDVCNPLA